MRPDSIKHEEYISLCFFFFFPKCSHVTIYWSSHKPYTSHETGSSIDDNRMSTFSSKISISSILELKWQQRQWDSWNCTWSYNQVQVCTLESVTFCFKWLRTGLQIYIPLVCKSPGIPYMYNPIFLPTGEWAHLLPRKAEDLRGRHTTNWKYNWVMSPVKTKYPGQEENN